MYFICSLGSINSGRSSFSISRNCLIVRFFTIAAISQEIKNDKNSKNWSNHVARPEQNITKSHWAEESVEQTFRENTLEESTIVHQSLVSESSAKHKKGEKDVVCLEHNVFNNIGCLIFQEYLQNEHDCKEAESSSYKFSKWIIKLVFWNKRMNQWKWRRLFVIRYMYSIYIGIVLVLYWIFVYLPKTKSKKRDNASNLCAICFIKLYNYFTASI